MKVAVVAVLAAVGIGGLFVSLPAGLIGLGAAILAAVLLPDGRRAEDEDVDGRRSAETHGGDGER